MLTMHFFNLFCVDNKVGKRLNTGNNVFATQLMLQFWDVSPQPSSVLFVL